MKQKLDSKFIFRGFTLVELLMCIGIMLIMTTVILGNYPESTMRLTVASNADKLLLLLREAQLRGSAIDSISGTTGGYGVFIDIGDPLKAHFFADTVDLPVAQPRPNGIGLGDGLYQSPAEWQKTISQGIGYAYDKICVINLGGTYTCKQRNTAFVPAPGVDSFTTMTISFKRPSQVAHIYVNGTTTDYSGACIELHSPKYPKTGHMRSIKIYHSGMMIMKQDPCI